MENKKDQQKVSIKLERHRWPDEIEKEKRRKRQRRVLGIAFILSFLLGFQANRIFSRQDVLPSNSKLSRFESVYQDVLKHWYFIDEYEDPEEILVDHAIKGMLEENNDRHTVYMTEDEVEKMTQSINMDFEGIGVQYHAGDLNVVTRVFKNSPAEKAGVQAGDILYRIDGEKVEGMESDEIQERILGESGTKVKVDFLRKQKIKEFEIERGKIQALVWGEMLDSEIAYLEISSFGQNLDEEILLYLDDLKGKGAKSLIIDLRNNGGGYLAAIEDIAPIFFDKEMVVYQEDHRAEKKKSYRVQKSIRDEYKFENIVLLLNENSASASEVFALAMRENNGSKIVGTNSFGKGTIQVNKRYEGGSALKLTVGKWLSPSGESINEVGIEPDYEVKLPDIFYRTMVELEDKVHYDEVHEAVSYVQDALSYLGYHQGRVDGYFDQASLKALQSYQKDHGFKKTDYIDQDILLQMYSSVVSDWSLNKDDRDIQLHKAIEVAKK